MITGVVLHAWHCLGLPRSASILILTATRSALRKVRMSRTPVYLHLSDPLDSLEESEASFDPSVRQRSVLETRIEEALQDSYNGVCLNITNDEWRRRWTSLCLTTPSPAEGGSASIPLSDELKEQQRVAELWRVSDAFNKSEVNITKLGGSKPFDSILFIVDPYSLQRRLRIPWASPLSGWSLTRPMSGCDKTRNSYVTFTSRASRFFV